MAGSSRCPSLTPASAPHWGAFLWARGDLVGGPFGAGGGQQHAIAVVAREQEQARFELLEQGGRTAHGPGPQALPLAQGRGGPEPLRSMAMELAQGLEGGIFVMEDLDKDILEFASLGGGGEEGGGGSMSPKGQGPREPRSSKEAPRTLPGRPRKAREPKEGPGRKARGPEEGGTPGALGPPFAPVLGR